MDNIIYFTLNAHKKCIGQYNFDPLLYLQISGNTRIERQGLYLDTPGTYSIKYVSGAICSFNTDVIMNELFSVNRNISKNQVYWNRYYETSSALIKLGLYDITYFPTSSILLACFQCQFGTLPGFTDTGYKTQALANTFNSRYLNNIDLKYNYTDVLKFSIQQPQDLVFWYTNITEQSVQGEITYSLQLVKNTVQTVYLNDISIIGVNKSNISQYSFENYYLNVYRQNISNIEISKSQYAWIKDIQNRNIVKEIYEFNTIGYDQAYLNDIKYTDTLNYSNQYSLIYYWELAQKVKSDYKFIGKFNKDSQDLLLYKGAYTIILINNGYIFQPGINIKSDTGMTFLTSAELSGKTIYSFYINNVDKFLFKFLQVSGITSEIYLYAGIITLDQLLTYIQKQKKNNIFTTQYNQQVINNLQKQLNLNKTGNQILNIQKITDFNEDKYNYYMDISQYAYYNESKPTFYIYASQKIENNLSVGPYSTPTEASANIFELFQQLKQQKQDYICKSVSTSIYLQQYNVYPKE